MENDDVLDQIGDVIDNIAAKNYTAANVGVQDVLNTKVSDALDQQKVAVAQSMVSSSDADDEEDYEDFEDNDDE